MDKKRLIQIIRTLEEIRVELDLNISDEQLFVQSCTYERGELANSKTPNKTSQVGDSASSGEKAGVIREADKPTQKQINFLKKGGIKINPNLTKQEANIMINNYINNLKRENI